MSSRKQPVHLFVSYDLASESVAREVIDRLRKTGAEVADVRSLTAGDAYTDKVREALRESDVVVAVVTSEQLNSNVLFELGAAVGAGKPVVVLLAGISSIQLPLDAQVLPIGRAEEVIGFARTAHAA